MGCEPLLTTYLRGDFSVISSPQNVQTFIRSYTMAEHCENVRAIYDCAKTAALGPNCGPVIPPEIRSLFPIAEDMLQFICIERIQDFEENFDCLSSFNPEQMEVIPQCKALQSLGPTTCQVSTFTDCTDALVDSNQQCSGNAKQLLRDYVRRILSHIPQCQGLHTLKELFF